MTLPKVEKRTLISSKIMTAAQRIAFHSPNAIEHSGV